LDNAMFLGLGHGGAVGSLAGSALDQGLGLAAGGVLSQARPLGTRAGSCASDGS